VSTPARTVVPALGQGYEVISVLFDEGAPEVIALPALALVADWQGDWQVDVTAVAVDGTPSGGHHGALRLPDGRVVDGESTVHASTAAWLDWLVTDRVQRGAACDAR
jgi:hypothetical protein